jgi:hypothetical protein
VATIDIQDLVDITKKRGLELGVAWIKTQFPWMGNSLVWVFIGPIVEMIVKTLMDEVDTFGFRFNSTFLTSAQAAEYREKQAKLLGLSSDISDEEWRRLDDEASKAFRNLVRYSS